MLLNHTSASSKRAARGHASRPVVRVEMSQTPAARFVRSPARPASPPLSSVFDSVLQCAVCLDPYDLLQRIPHILHSSHTVCALCVDELCGHAGSAHIRCPLCQTAVDSSQRTENTLVVHMMQAMMQHQSQRQREAAESKEEKRPSGSRSVADEDKEADEDAEEDGPGAAFASTATPAVEAKKKKRNKKKKNNRTAAISAPTDASSSSASSPSASAPSASSASSPSSSSAVATSVSAGSASASAAAVLVPARRESRLTDTRLFPAFDALPEPWEPNSRHYIVRNGKRYPRYHWAYVGEIQWLQNTGRTIAMQLVDRTWQRVHCQLPLYWQEVDAARFQVGWTVVIRYAEARRKDGRMGDTMDMLTTEDYKLITTLPASLAGVLEYDEDLAAREERDRAAGAGAAADPLHSKCSFCQALGASKLCAGCRVAEYCNRDCQTSDWKDSHKTSCRIWSTLRDIHLDVGEELQGEAPRSYSKREISSAPPESRIQSVWVPFKSTVYIREL